jgi:hypothetical protein
VQLVFGAFIKYMPIWSAASAVAIIVTVTLLFLWVSSWRLVAFLLRHRKETVAQTSLVVRGPSSPPLSTPASGLVSRLCGCRPAHRPTAGILKSAFVCLWGATWWAIFGDLGCVGWCENKLVGMVASTQCGHSFFGPLTTNSREPA